METERRVLANASMLAGSQVIAQLANFGFVIVLARSYGAGTLGEYSFALSLGALVAAFVSLGVPQLVLRSEAAEAGTWRSLTGIVLPVQLLLALIGWLLILGGAHLVSADSQRTWLIALVSAFQLLLPISALLAAAFSAREKMAYSAGAEALRRIGILVFGTAAMWVGLPPSWAVLAMPVSAAAVALVLYRLARRRFGAPALRVSARALRQVLRRALPFFWFALASILYMRIGVLLLRTLSGAETVGVFSAGERLVAAATMVPSMLVNALMPPLVRLWATDHSGFRTLVAQGQRLLLLFALPGATVLAIFAPDIVALLYGAGYERTTSVLRVVAWLMVVRSLFAVISAVAVAQHRESDLVAARVTGIIVLAGVCGGLAPTYGAMALAVAVLLAEVAVLFGVLLRLREAAMLASLRGPAVRIIAACLLTAAVAFYLEGLDLWIRAAGVAAVGLASLSLFRAVHWHDVTYLLRIMGLKAAV